MTRGKSKDKKNADTKKKHVGKRNNNKGIVTER